MDTGLTRLFDNRSSKRSLGTRHVGTKFLVYDLVTSTNDLAHFLAKNGEPAGTVVFAHGQTNGKGRLGNAWQSPRGGLYCTVILRPDLQIHQLTRVTLITALSIVRALKDWHVPHVSIKWPNDVLVAGKKIAGILTEMSLSENKVSYVVVGLGVNVNTNLDELPEQAVSLKQVLRKECDIADLAHNILKHMDGYYDQLACGSSGLRDEMKAVSGLMMGQRVRLLSENDSVEGYAVDFDENGGLVLRLDNGFLKTFHSGHLIKAEGHT